MYLLQTRMDPLAQQMPARPHLRALTNGKHEAVLVCTVETCRTLFALSYKNLKKSYSRHYQAKHGDEDIESALVANIRAIRSQVPKLTLWGARKDTAAPLIPIPGLPIVGARACTFCKTRAFINANACTKHMKQHKRKDPSFKRRPFAAFPQCRAQAG